MAELPILVAAMIGPRKIGCSPSLLWLYCHPCKRVAVIYDGEPTPRCIDCGAEMVTLKQAEVAPRTGEYQPNKSTATAVNPNDG